MATVICARGESRAREHEDTDIPLLALTQDCLDANL